MNVPNLSVLPQAFFDALARIFVGNSYVQSGLTLSPQGAATFQINVAAGTGWINGVYLGYAGGSVTPAIAAALPRYDVVRIASGAIVPSIVAGTASATPTPPSISAGDLFLGYAFINAGTTDYTTTSFIADFTMPAQVIPSGTAANPGLPLAASLLTGLYRSAANIIGFAINGAAALTLSATSLNAATGTKVQENSVSLRQATTKGDLETYSSAFARLAVGSTSNPGNFLRADSSAATGLAWSPVIVITKAESATQFSTASVTFVTITAITTTVSVASTSNPVEYLLTGTVQADGVRTGTYAIVNSTDSATPIVGVPMIPSASGLQSSMVAYRQSTQATGSKTIEGQLKTSAGTSFIGTGNQDYYSICVKEYR